MAYEYAEVLRDGRTRDAIIYEAHEIEMVLRSLIGIERFTWDHTKRSQLNNAIWSVTFRGDMSAGLRSVMDRMLRKHQRPSLPAPAQTIPDGVELATLDQRKACFIRVYEEIAGRPGDNRLSDIEENHRRHIDMWKASQARFAPARGVQYAEEDE